MKSYIFDTAVQVSAKEKCR